MGRKQVLGEVKMVEGVQAGAPFLEGGGRSLGLPVSQFLLVLVRSLCRVRVLRTDACANGLGTGIRWLCAVTTLGRCGAGTWGRVKRGKRTPPLARSLECKLQTSPLNAAAPVQVSSEEKSAPICIVESEWSHVLYYFPSQHSTASIPVLVLLVYY
jgi:hypothetical protein